MQNRSRNEQLIVRVTPEEKKLIQRKMLIDGYCVLRAFTARKGKRL